ncbi:hypothetical protein REPUB_Repub05bG0004100 [Reevesia pubescens]
MTVGAGISMSDGRLTVSGSCILHAVHDNVVNWELRFMCVFRHKFWWMTQWMGAFGKDIPFETQFLVVEVCDDTRLDEGSKDEAEQSVVYAVFLPILEGDFRAVLQGNEQNEMEICLESGDPAVDKFEGSHLVFVAAGSDPYDVITNSMPDILNWFVWCTWDAFYTNVTAEGLKQGLESLEKGEAPPKFVIIDDGWQTVGMDSTGIEYRSDYTANFANRLLHIKENHKSQKNGKEDHKVDDPATGLRCVVSEMKDRHTLKYVYVWHAITGYWGGVKPGITEMEHYEPKLVYPISSPGVQSNDYCEVLQNITMNGVGLVSPDKVFDFYNDLHSYLASAGIDGVKVDVQSILETLGAGHGGRVKLTRKYHQALEASISSNFHDNAIIACMSMSHNTDTLYSATSTAVMRASDDFFPRDPSSHTIHIASVAYNTIFIGEFMQPDWDMFHSLHPMAEYHGAARAVGGCAIYVSDKPGLHDFNLLKKLVLPDGSVLRAKLPGRPTRDCLFSDPVRDGKSLLKIWNLNDFTGVIGVFNCQRAGWCGVTKKMVSHDEQSGIITGFIRARDVDYLPEVAGDGWTGDSILYSHRGGEVAYLARNASMSITLKPREYELFTMVPVMALSNGAKFAPIGLIKMFNSGGAIKELKYESEKSTSISLKVRGCGLFGAYSSTQPQRIIVDSQEVQFEYEVESGLITIAIRVPEEELYLWNIVIEL